MKNNKEKASRKMEKAPFGFEINKVGLNNILENNIKVPSLFPMKASPNWEIIAAPKIKKNTTEIVRIITRINPLLGR